jgi:hypothetical protein
MLVGYAEALGGAKAAARHDGGDIDPNQELMAHAPARMLSGLFGGLLGRRQPVQDLGGRGCRRPHLVRQSPRRGLLLPHAGFVDAAVPRHAAPGVRRYRHRGDRSVDL